MATRIKRTSKKSGNMITTKTYSSKGGMTYSTSTKPQGSPTRRTTSFNNRTGKSRTTYSTKGGGGWTTISSKTTGGSTRRKSSGRSRGGSVNLGGLITIPIVLFLGVALLIMYTWPVTIPYIVGGVLALVIVGVVINLLIIAIPWIILGGVLYGLYSIANFIR
jgi:hypothetical protein